LLLLAAFSFPPPAAAEVYIDEVGRRVDIPSPPRRIVSLAPSITETLFALGLDEEIVGVTVLSTYPEAARSKPRVGTFVSISIERVVALNPDLVIGIADGNRKETVEQLERIGFPVYIVDPKSIEEIFRMVLDIGRVVKRGDRAAVLVDGLRTRVDRTASSLKGLKRPRVFLQIGISPIITAGKGSFHSELICRAGGVNIYGDETVRYPRCGLEDVIARKPEVIIVSSMKQGGNFPAVREGWERWHTIPAVRDGRIYVIDTDLVDLASPRIVDGLEKMAEIIHPEVSWEKR